MEATATFKQEVKDAWGHPSRVADAALNELFRHSDEIGGLDYDDQVKYAIQVGVLAGELKNSDPETFIQRFEAEILSGD